MFLDAEAQIIHRLKSHIPEFKAVLQGKDFSQLKSEKAEALMITPCAYVLYDSYAVEETGNRGVSSRITQNWMVVICVKHVQNSFVNGGARTVAGELVDRVLDIIPGWQASNMASPFKLATPPPPIVSGQIAYYPMAFKASMIVTNPNSEV